MQIAGDAIRGVPCVSSCCILKSFFHYIFYLPPERSSSLLCVIEISVLSNYSKTFSSSIVDKSFTLSTIGRYED